MGLAVLSRQNLSCWEVSGLESLKFDWSKHPELLSRGVGGCGRSLVVLFGEVVLE